MRSAVFAIVIIGMTAVSAPGALSDEAAPGAAPPQLARPSEAGKPYTSLVVDAAGLNLQRSMSPKIRQADATEVWGTVKVDYDFVEEHGLVAYASSLDDARKNSRCGSNPMVVKALSILGPGSSDPVIAKEDAVLLASENSKGKFLEKFNVIFVRGDSPTLTARAN